MTRAAVCSQLGDEHLLESRDDWILSALDRGVGGQAGLEAQDRDVDGQWRFGARWDADSAAGAIGSHVVGRGGDDEVEAAVDGERHVEVAGGSG